MATGKIWDAVERDDYRTYDSFVSFLTDIFAPRGEAFNMHAHNVEDEINKNLADVFTKLENKYD